MGRKNNKLPRGIIFYDSSSFFEKRRKEIEKEGKSDTSGIIEENKPDRSNPVTENICEDVQSNITSYCQAPEELPTSTASDYSHEKEIKNTTSERSILQCSNPEVKTEMAFELSASGFSNASIANILYLKQEEVEKILKNNSTNK